jgi:hypothetical protein
MAISTVTTATPASEKAVRARRIFCSNRGSRPGCGRTISVWLADKIRRVCTSTRRLWSFLQRAVADGIAEATRQVGGPLSARTWQRLWRRFFLGQSRIRTLLLSRHPPPKSAAASRHAPVAQVLAHLQAAFPDADTLAAFQFATRSFII